MRTLAITENITLDGSIEFLDDWFDPQDRGLGEMADLQAEVQRQSEASDALLVGRRTFEDFRSYWPHREDGTTDASDYLDAVATYVVSTTLTEPGWENTTILSGDPVELVAALEEERGRDIALTGSIRLGHALIHAGLVDELRLFTYQVDRLRLIGQQAFESGVVLATYATR